MNDDESEVGYKKPPLAGRIKKGERRNPYGRRGKKKAPSAARMTDAEIIAMIDNELIDFQGRKITKREAELRLLQANALRSDLRASQTLDNLRKRVKSDKPAAGGGVLLVPSPVPLHEWSASAAIQQAKFRGDDPEGLAELERFREGMRDQQPGSEDDGSD